MSISMLLLVTGVELCAQRRLKQVLCRVIRVPCADVSIHDRRTIHISSSSFLSMRAVRPPTAALLCILACLAASQAQRGDPIDHDSVSATVTPTPTVTSTPSLTSSASVCPGCSPKVQVRFPQPVCNMSNTLHCDPNTCSLTADIDAAYIPSMAQPQFIGLIVSKDCITWWFAGTSKQIEYAPAAAVTIDDGCYGTGNDWLVVVGTVGPVDVRVLEFVCSLASCCLGDSELLCCPLHRDLQYLKNDSNIRCITTNPAVSFTALGGICLEPPVSGCCALVVEVAKPRSPRCVRDSVRSVIPQHPVAGLGYPPMPKCCSVVIDPLKPKPTYVWSPWWENNVCPECSPRNASKGDTLMMKRCNVNVRRSGQRFVRFCALCVQPGTWPWWAQLSPRSSWALGSPTCTDETEGSAA